LGWSPGDDGAGWRRSGGVWPPASRASRRRRRRRWWRRGRRGRPPCPLDQRRRTWWVRPDGRGREGLAMVPDHINLVILLFLYPSFNHVN
jgi:hypothetical protein